MAAGAGSCGPDDRRAASRSEQPTSAGPDSGRAGDFPRHGQHGVRYSKCQCCGSVGSVGMFLGLLHTDLDPLEEWIRLPSQNSKKNLDSCCFVTSF